MGIAFLLAVALVALIVVAGLATIIVVAVLRALSLAQPLFIFALPQGLRAEKCWDVMNCPPERRLGCPAYTRGFLPCWLAVRLPGVMSHKRGGCLVCLRNLIHSGRETLSARAG